MCEDWSAFCERIDKIDAPLLIIGLGGTGKDAVRTVKKTFARRFRLHGIDNYWGNNPAPRRTGYLVIDSDVTDTQGFDQSEFIALDAGIPLYSMLKDPSRTLSVQQKKWFHHDLRKIGEDDGFFLGTYRAVSRLMLDINFGEIYHRIHDTLQRLVTVYPGDPPLTRNMAYIFVITGIGGGTGSGTFLDIGQIIRHMMANDPHLGIPYTLNSYIVMPDVTHSNLMEAGASESMCRIIRATSYAALKELDFWMDYDRHRTPYTMEYTCGVNIKWTKPFDHVTLMSGANVAGAAFRNSYKLVQRTIAEQLLHYMAEENNYDNAFSVLNYEDSLDFRLETFQNSMPLPLNHAYRTIGVYGKRIPWKDFLDYEGRLLLRSFIPPRNEHGVPVPNDSLLTDGRWESRFKDILEVPFNTHLANFTVPFPAICEDFDAGNDGMVERLRNARNPVHDSYISWQETIVAPAAGTYADQYLNAVWDRFAQTCRTIMRNPELGPFSLLQYLDDPGKSLLVGFESYLRMANSFCNAAYQSIPQLRADCYKLYSQFCNPPLLGRRRAIQQYLDTLKTLLDAVRQYELLKQYVVVMEMMCQRIETYREKILRPLCDLLVNLEAEFSTADTAVDHLSSDLFEASAYQQEIRDIFAAANLESRVSQVFLGRLCDSTFDTEPNVDTLNGGLTFLFGRDMRTKTLRMMKEEMDDCFDFINDQRMDSFLQQMFPNGNHASYISSLADSVVWHAEPLFSLAYHVAAAHAARRAGKRGYMFFPVHTPTFMNHIPHSVDGVSLTPVSSCFTDHIFCSVMWDALPLYSYALMDELKKAYDDTLATYSLHAKSLHLVRTGERDSDYTRNWCRLPSPAPFYLFSQEANSIADAEEYKNVRVLVDRALACGMLTIDSTEAEPKERPEYTFRIFRSPDGVPDNETRKADLEEALSLCDSATGSLDTLLQALADLITRAEERVYVAQKSPIVMKNKLGIDGATAPLDPYYPEIQHNPQELQQAKANFYRLTVEYSVHILLQNPALLRDVQKQIEAFEAIGKATIDIKDQASRWEPRIAYAKTFSELVEYGYILFDMMKNPVFLDDSGKLAAFIQPALLRNDLKKCTPVVKSVGAAADMDAEHAIRKTLEFRLGNDKKNWDISALASALTEEQVKTHIERLEGLKKQADKERSYFISQKMADIRADHALLDKYIALLACVDNYAKNRLEILHEIIPDPVPIPTPGRWNCLGCGAQNVTGKFCDNCDAPKPDDTWNCPGCGTQNVTGRFCYNCGSQRPQNT